MSDAANRSYHRVHAVARTCRNGTVAHGEFSTTNNNNYSHALLAADEVIKIVLAHTTNAVLSRGVAQGAVPCGEPTPTKEEFAKWSRVWHDTCETIVTMLGLPGSGSPQELLAQVQAYVTASPAQSSWQPISQLPETDPKFLGSGITLLALLPHEEK